MDSPLDENSRLSEDRIDLKEEEGDEEEDHEEEEEDEEEDDDEEDEIDEQEEDFEVEENASFLIGASVEEEAEIEAETEAPGSPKVEGSPPVRKRGRPCKADSLRRQSEDSTPKKRGRKPLPKEERERIKAAKKEKRRLELLEKRKANGEVRKKPGRKSLVLTAEEKEKREQARRAKYEEFKKAKAEKAAKRAERNEQLRLLRKQKKEEEAKQREAYEKRMQELKASFLDENTQMSSGIGEFVDGLQDETSQSSISSKKGFINEMAYIDRVRNVTSETLLEYRWPLEGKSSEYYFLQEQVCEYLGIKSFKRRYPDVARRKIDFEERDFLVEMKIVSEMQADLGLTAIPSSEVLDIMSKDFYEKYDEYMNVISERKDRNIRQVSYTTVTVEKHHLADFVERAVQSTAEWNKKMNKDRSENRKAYFDLQTFNIHYPMNNRGRMRVISKPKLGHYPIAIIPGQFTDYFRKYTPSQLKYMPLNSTLAGPPQSGTRIDCIDSPPDLDMSDSSDCSTCSDSLSSSSGSEEEEEEENNDDKEKSSSLSPPDLKRNDIDKPGARCKDCQGDRLKNKVGVPEDLLHCSKCDLSAHPTCIGLSLEHVPFVKNYDWECTECKKCIKCKDHSDEEKMLFCDLCDRGFHIYCVGLDEVPIGRWHCFDCSYCFSCGSKDPDGGDSDINSPKWTVEYKSGGGPSRVFSHTLCSPCHKLTKKGQFCPECNKVFGREEAFSDKTVSMIENIALQELVACWVCTRQHHSKCVKQSLFICSGCQKRTKEKSIGSDAYFPLSLNKGDWNERSPRLKPSRASASGSPAQHVCEACGKVYKNRASLYTHKHRDHGNGSKTPLMK